jgi:hypothetical protein
MTAITYGPRLVPTLGIGALALALCTSTATFARAASAETGEAPAILEAPDLAPDAWYKVNCSARGLGGEKAPTDHGPNIWENTPEWRDYQQWIDSRWTYIERVRLNAMRTWAASSLPELREQSRSVFYPFSGPDVLYVDTFFPNSKYLLMAGLEPVGTMPDLAALEQQGKLGPYLAQVKTSLFTILAASFFKTKDMKSDFNNQLMDGLMPAIVVFLSRLGYTIDGIEYVSLDHGGALHPRGEKTGAPGVEITYFKGDRSNVRTLFYFQADLGNDGLKSNPGFVRLMEQLGPGVTYLKAASYLLHEDYFSIIRHGILDNSTGVLEDDSGIPFRDFKPDVWTVIPYGNYTGPIDLFKQSFQPDLLDFYTKTPHEPLTFGSGYKYVAATSSLLVAKKK